MSGDFVFTVYGLILHAEEYFFYKQKYDCRSGYVLCWIVNGDEWRIIDKTRRFP